MTQVTDELRLVIEAEVDRAVRDMGKWDESVGHTEKKLDDLERASEKMSNKLMLVSGGFLAAGGAGLKFAADIETQKTSLEVLIGDVDKAAGLFEELQTFSAKTPLSMGDINSATTQMLNFGTSTEDVTSVLNMLGNAAMGNSQKLDTVVRAYGRIQLKGKASMEELNMLTEAQVPILDALSESLGVSTDELFKMASAGKVSFADVKTAMEALTGEGGRLNGMLERQSQTLSGKLSTALDNVKISLAKTMEDVVPIVKDLLDTVSRVAEAFGNMDPAARKAVVSMIAMGAVIGPVSKAGTAVLGLVKAASGLATMNPVLLGIGAVTIAVSALAAAFLKAKVEAANTKSGLDSWKQAGASALSAATSYKEVQSVLPGLTSDMYAAAKAAGDFQKAVGESEKLTGLRAELSRLENEVRSKSRFMQTSLAPLLDVLNKPINTASKSWAEGPATAEAKLKDVSDAMADLYGRGKEVLSVSKEFREAYSARNFEGMVKAVESLDAAEPKIKAQITELKKQIETIASGATITPKVVPPPVAAARKTWQDWFEEITDVDQASFGRSGQKAAELYVEGLGEELRDATVLGKILGETIDPVPYLEKQKDSIRETLASLFKIPKEDVDQSFQFGLELDKEGAAKVDASVQVQIDRFRELTAAIDDAKKARQQLTEHEEAAKTAADMIKSLETPLDQYLSRLQEIDKVWKNNKFEGELLNQEQYLKLIAAAGEDYAAAVRAIKAAQESATRTSFDDFLANILSTLAQDAGMARETADAIANLGVKIASVVGNAALDGLQQMAALWAEGGANADDYASAIAAAAQQILNSLPTLLMQAGLALIPDPTTRALGIGLVFGGLASTIIAGLTEGYLSRQDTASAKGNVFASGALVPFANGGAFSNGVVSRAVTVPMALMGEKSPEAIVPLTRMSNGDLGVQSQGSDGGSQMSQTVNVYNYSGERIQRRERSTGNNSKTIEILVGSLVDKNISTGRHDSSMGARYSLKKPGVRS